MEYKLVVIDMNADIKDSARLNDDSFANSFYGAVQEIGLKTQTLPLHVRKNKHLDSNVPNNNTDTTYIIIGKDDDISLETAIERISEFHRVATCKELTYNVHNSPMSDDNFQRITNSENVVVFEDKGALLEFINT
jgi:hypothetical protein